VIGLQLDSVRELRESLNPLRGTTIRDYALPMNYTFFDFLQLVGSLGLFIYGMKILSEGLQRIAGNRLRAVLKGMTSNRFVGIITGFLATVITQSSTTTTVMVVSFVNAGLLTFIEATGMIMGANIGTTVTAWMVSIFGFKLKITPIAIALIGISFPFMFARSTKLRHIAETAIGFGILFIGLEFLKDAVPNIQDNPEILAFLGQFTDLGIGTTLIFILVGTLLTLMTQSSSASTAITLVMLAQGWINFPIAAAMILGENIGTTVTANIAALVGNVHAKRAALFHFIFNVVGVTWMICILPSFLLMIDSIMFYFVPGHISVFMDTPESRIGATLALSLFHTLFNIANVLLLVFLVPLLVRFVIYLKPSRGGQDELFTLKYIGSNIASPEISIVEVQRELELFAKVIDKMSFSFRGLLFKHPRNHQKFLEKIAKREQITDNIQLEIAEYLTRVSEHNLTLSESRRIRSILNMINDLERIGDLYFQMSKSFERMRELGLQFDSVVLDELKQMISAVYEGITLTRTNLSKDYGSIDLQEAYRMEQGIDQLRDRLKASHFERVEKGVYSDPKIGFIYLDYLNRMEKIGDHLLNINEAIAGEK